MENGVACFLNTGKKGGQKRSPFLCILLYNKYKKVSGEIYSQKPFCTALKFLSATFLKLTIEIKLLFEQKWQMAQWKMK